MEKRVVDIESIQLAQHVLREFNKLKLSEIEIRERGEKLLIPDKCIGFADLCGLSNAWFVDQRIWEDGDRDIAE